MKVWQITAPQTMKLSERDDKIVGEDCAKVKLTRVGLSKIDINVYKGVGSINYPIVPCHQGVGIISETGSEENGFLRGQRVVIEPFLACGSCSNCKQGKYDICEQMIAYGIDDDGMLRDFIIVPQESLFQLPDHVKDDEAIFVDHIALALNILAKLDIQKGEHLAIIGAGITGAVLAQAAIYYQAVPILIDDSEEKLENAKNAGVYYAINRADCDVAKKLRSITGGRMCECVAFLSGSNAKAPEAFDYAAHNGRVALVGWDLKNTMDATDMSPILDKHLTVCGVTSGYRLISNAINMLANKTVDVSGLVAREVAFSDAAEVFQSFAEGKVTPNKLIFKI